MEKDYDLTIKGLISEEHYKTMLNEFGVKNLNELNENHLNRILYEIHRQFDGQK